VGKRLAVFDPTGRLFEDLAASHVELVPYDPADQTIA